MSQSTVKHATIVLERRLSAPPARVFAAWADPAIRVKWDIPGHDWETTEQEQSRRRA